MKKLFSKLFGRTVNLKNGISTFVTVLESSENRRKNEILFHGFVSRIDFDDRIITIAETDSYKDAVIGTRTLCIDKIVSMSRLMDGRLRMWIKKED